MNQNNPSISAHADEGNLHIWHSWQYSTLSTLVSSNLSVSLSEPNRQYVKTGGANASQAATGGLNMAAMTQGQWHVLVWYLWMKSFDSSPAPLASFGFRQQCPSIILLQP